MPWSQPQASSPSRTSRSPSPAARRRCAPSTASISSVGARRGRGADRRIGLGQERHPALAAAPASGAAHAASRARIAVDGRDVLAMRRPRARAISAARVASMIFQEPLLALDPVYTLGEQIVESIRRHERDRRGRGARRGRSRCFERVRIPLPGAAARRLSARDVRRHAPARDDRAGARLPAEAAAGRRADHRARRHGADPDPAPAARAAARPRPVGDLRDARHRRRRRGRRPHRRHVCRADRRGRHGARPHPRAAPSLHHRAPEEPRPRRPREGRTARDHPRLAARSREPAARLRLSRRAARSSSIPAVTSVRRR